VLRDPLLYLSLFLKQHRATYFDLLDRVRRDGDWEAWLSFFLAGVHQTAEGAVSTTQQLSAMFKEDRKRIEKAGRRAGSALRLHDAIKARPLLSLQEICRISGTTLIPLKTLAARVAELPRDRDIVVHCKHGGRGVRAVEFLLSAGFTRVQNMAGGIHAWIDTVDPSQAKY
jgi:rhodanese-related sulfurtransferase